MSHTWNTRRAECVSKRISRVIGHTHPDKKLCDEYNIKQGQITIACDNIAAGLSLQGLVFPNPSQNHFNILQAIFRTKPQLPISVSYKHVEGHQSTKYPGLELDKWGVLNEEMDALTKAYLSYSEHLPSLSQEVDSHEWSVNISDKKICTKLKKQLSQSVTTQAPTVSNEQHNHQTH